MKPWLMALAFARGRRLVTLPPITSNESVTIPAGVTSVNMTGSGARGQDASQVAGYREDQYFNARRRSDGGTTAIAGQTTYGGGPPPASYCGQFVDTPSDPTYSAVQTCYAYYAANYESPATTGASATAIGKTFPGSIGNTPPPVTTFANVPVSGGSSYSIVVPFGGSITISYYQ